MDVASKRQEYKEKGNQLGEYVTRGELLDILEEVSGGKPAQPKQPEQPSGPRVIGGFK